MNFQEAMLKMKHGKKVRRKTWDDDYFIHIESGNLITRYDDNPEIDLMDLEATDWEMWEIHQESEVSNSKYFGFSEAIRRMKQGKHISLKFWNNPKVYLYLYHRIYMSTGTSVDEIRVKTIRGIDTPWMPNHTELVSEEYYEVDGE